MQLSGANPIMRFFGIAFNTNITGIINASPIAPLGDQEQITNVNQTTGVVTWAPLTTQVMSTIPIPQDFLVPERATLVITLENGDAGDLLTLPVAMIQDL